METESVKIEKQILDKLRPFCTKNGIILSWFVSRAVEEKLNNGQK